MHVRARYEPGKEESVGQRTLRRLTGPLTPMEAIKWKQTEHGKYTIKRTKKNFEGGGGIESKVCFGAKMTRKMNFFIRRLQFKRTTSGLL